MTVLPFPGGNTKCVGTDMREHTIAPEAVAAGCVKQAPRLEQLIVMGVSKEGQLYLATTSPDVADILLLMDRVKAKMMRVFNDKYMGDQDETR